MIEVKTKEAIHLQYKTRMLIIHGAPCAGKTSTSKLLIDNIVQNRPKIRVSFLQGDSFAHINCPWNASSEQLNAKYGHIQVILERVFMTSDLIILDDFIRRGSDLERLRDFSERHGCNSVDIFLYCPVKEMIERNNNRIDNRKYYNDKTMLDFQNLARKIFDSVKKDSSIEFISSDSVVSQIIKQVLKF